MVCCFFGHRNAPGSVRDALTHAITDLITNRSVTNFYVGDQGQFDSMVRRVLRGLKKKYPHISYSVVLAYMPGQKSEYDREEESEETLYPDGLESVPRRFAISRRNEWMVSRSDIVICYITHSSGGAAKYCDMARRKGKEIINLGETGE